MRRHSPTLHFLTTAAATDSAISNTISMSSRHPYRGGRRNWKRGFYDGPHAGRGGQVVIGDSHFQSVRDANLELRRSDGGGCENHTGFRTPSPTPPPPYSHNAQIRQPYHHSQNQRFHQPQKWDRNQAFSPPRQFRPRPADYRDWEYGITQPPSNCERFVILSYNILADYLAMNHRRELYFHIPIHMLEWSWRKRNIMFELGLWSADILCLQEVDRFYDLEEDLKHKGYTGIWKMRTGNPVDGCAIFWRQSRFKLLKEEFIEFNKFGLRDNVAQICVLELVNQNGSPQSSLTGSSKVVICNIHVLFNPNRGEIKIGQIRVLLDRAKSVSNIWDGAPVVICGDFNCTPKSPLYNFIAEGKLDMSGVSRNKVSGQASAVIHSSRRYNPNTGEKPADNSTQPSPLEDFKRVGIRPCNSPSEVQKLDNHDDDMENVSEISEVQCDVSSGTQCDDFSIEAQCSATDSSKMCNSVLRSAQKLPDAASPSKQESSPRAIKLDSNTTAENEGLNQDNDTRSSLQADNQLSTIKNDRENAQSFGSNVSSGKLSYQSSFSDAEISFQGYAARPTVDPCTNDQNIVCPNSDQEDISCFAINEKLENLHLNELDEAVTDVGTNCEDENAFLSALHDNDATSQFYVDSCSKLDSERPDQLKELECAPSNSPSLLESEESKIDLSPELDLEAINVERARYDPSLWSPMEIETATGDTECTLLKHPLMLKSTYTEVKDSSGTRDSNGEPQVTSYNRRFLGTVDYIWRTEGLQTIKVLAPMPKHAMEWTPGFPTKVFTEFTVTPVKMDMALPHLQKWGSDHIALVSELAFTKDTGNIIREV